jgi:hypothetical protein
VRAGYGTSTRVVAVEPPAMDSSFTVEFVSALRQLAPARFRAR